MTTFLERAAHFTIPSPLFLGIYHFSFDFGVFVLTAPVAGDCLSLFLQPIRDCQLHVRVGLCLVIRIFENVWSNTPICFKVMP